MAGVLNLCFSIFKVFLLSAPFSEGCGGEIPEETKRNLSQSYGRWIVGFHEPSPAPFLRSKRALQIGGMIVCFGLCPCQHNGTYTRNVHPATPTKKLAQILRFAESKNAPLSRKILGKAAQKALGKGSSPLILPKPFLISFFPTSKIGRKKARKSLKLLGFSQRHLFGCSLMVETGGLEPSTSCV